LSRASNSSTFVGSGGIWCLTSLHPLQQISGYNPEQCGIEVLVLYRKRPGYRPSTNERIGGPGRFRYSELEGSLFGNWSLWILDTVCAARRAVRRGRGADVRRQLFLLLRIGSSQMPPQTLLSSLTAAPRYQIAARTHRSRYGACDRFEMTKIES
jgi:hypothetical protein